MIAVGKALMVKILVPTASHPLASVTVTVYGPAVDTVIDAVVAVVFHLYVPVPAAVKHHFLKTYVLGTTNGRYR
ncbi:MAG: hypothetical protein IPO92_11470 [Saprospiraceae bacterium]|nr:hypothetical protein [Saprospiraceae bacterium]